MSNKPPYANGSSVGPGVEPPVEPEHISIRIQVQYSKRHSDPKNWRYVFVYHVTISNVGMTTVQLYWRHWDIFDSLTGIQNVEGEGVVGECPVLGPGDAHEYESFCVLRSPTGHMEGFYHFRKEDGSTFRAPIPRFHFHAPPDESGTLIT